MAPKIFSKRQRAVSLHCCLVHRDVDLFHSWRSSGTSFGSPDIEAGSAVLYVAACTPLNFKSSSIMRSYVKGEPRHDLNMRYHLRINNFVMKRVVFLHNRKWRCSPPGMSKPDSHRYSQLRIKILTSLMLCLICIPFRRPA